MKNKKKNTNKSNVHSMYLQLLIKADDKYLIVKRHM